MAQDGGTWGGRFVAKVIAAEKAKAGLQHGAVCPNVMARTKKRIAQSKHARSRSLAIDN